MIDDALNLFAVEIREESRGFDPLIAQDLRDAGVEIREGRRARVNEGPAGDYLSLWFRRSAVH
jgi:hypothetical protein